MDLRRTEPWWRRRHLGHPQPGFPQMREPGQRRHGDRYPGGHAELRLACRPAVLVADPAADVRLRLGRRNDLTGGAGTRAPPRFAAAPGAFWNTRDGSP